MAEMTENLIRLRLVSGVGNAILWRLLVRFGDSDRVLGAEERELAAVPGMTRDKARRILESSRIDPRPELEKAAGAGIDVIPYDDPSYPKPLLHTFDPPAVLYVRGRLEARDQVAVGMVGTRRASQYGRDNARLYAAALARGGYTIVSGLARGIDTCAHQGALDAGGRTVGVLGCGFDHMYPEENRDLALEMTRNGAVLSEFPMATPPARDTFPARNRIIAGMSLGLVVIEAPLRSGSLITARLANEMGRSVFVLPGRVGEAAAEGSNKLLRDGAVVVTSVEDIFADLHPTLPPSAQAPQPPRASQSPRRRTAARRCETAPAALFEPAAESPRAGAEPALPVPAAHVPPAVPAAPPAAGPSPRLNPNQQAVLACVGADWLTVDDVTDAAALPAGTVSAALAFLKILHLVEQGPGQTYRLRRAGERHVR